jgi:hypothetical protein
MSLLLMSLLRVLNGMGIPHPPCGRDSRRRGQPPSLLVEVLENRMCPVLNLTPAGVARGISISIFAVDFPTIANVGPFGMAFPSNGGVLVSDAPGNVRLFPTDTDGQSADWFSPAQNYGGFANAADLVQVDGNIYMSQNPNGSVIQINEDGTFNQVIVSGIPGAAGMAVNRTNGHLFVSASSIGQIVDVDPVAQTSTLFVNGVADGLAISADGSTLYASDPTIGHVIGYDTSTASIVFDSGVIPGGIDGITEGTGSLAGNLYVNVNNGTVVEVNIADPTQNTVIADRGSRGDFVTVDPHDGSVFFTQTDRIVRLRFPTGPAPRHFPGQSTFASGGAIAGLLPTTERDFALGFESFRHEAGAINVAPLQPVQYNAVQPMTLGPAAGSESVPLFGATMRHPRDILFSAPESTSDLTEPLGWLSTAELDLLALSQ